MATAREALSDAVPSAAAEPATFAEHFEEDFRLALPLGTGRPNSSDPLQILATDPSVVANAATAVVCGVNAANGRLWKLFGLSWQEKNGRQLLCVSTDVAEVTDDDGIEMVARAFYFDPVDVALSPDRPWPLPGRVVPDCGMPVPFELGWLHLLRTYDYEATTPGLGYGYDYVAPGVDGSLYVFSDGRDLGEATVHSPVVRDAAERALAGILEHKAGASMSDVQLLDGEEGGLAPLLYSFGRLSNGNHTLLLLAVAQARLVKLRLSWDPDAPRELQEHAVHDFRLMVSGGPRPT
jgi:hypothetical protein